MSVFKPGDSCCICGKEWEKGARYAHHHTSYDTDTTVILCYRCHVLLHGTAKTWSHPFSDETKTKNNKDKSPYEFAKKVIEVYDAPI